LLPYSPHARGVLCGDRNTERTRTDSLAQQSYGRPSDLRAIDVVRKLASTRGCTPSQMAMAWVLRQPGVTSAIFGASSVKQVQEAVAATDIVLDNDEVTEIDRLYEPRLYAGH
jgi:1-deoxyxylulose-5-phosphate synthase